MKDFGSPSRRRFLQALLGAVTGSLLLPPTTWALPNGQRALVVGAGISGLAAAVDLAARGFTVVVVEGRDRIGGRIHTVRSADGMALDLGASWIHGISRNPIYALARRARLPLVPTNYNSGVEYGADGVQLSATREIAKNRLFRKVMAAVWNLQDDAGRFESLQDGIEAVIADMDLSAEQLADLAFMVNTEIEHDYGGDAADLSLAEWDQDSEFGGADMLFRGGYDQITRRLAAGLDVRLGAVVSQIDYGAGGVTVHTSIGDFTVDKVVVTLPLGVLKAGRVAFSPALPIAKRQAISRLGMGVLNKLALRFPSVFWPRTKQVYSCLGSTVGHWAEWYNLLRCTGKPVLVGFNAGSSAAKLESLDDAATLDSGMAVLRRIFGPTIPDPLEYSVTRWNSDPFCLGSYSHIPPGASGDDFESLADSVAGKLFFAGEATSRKYPQTVHGAYLSGLRAAQRAAGVIA